MNSRGGYEYLGDELVCEQILSRLPVKSLFRFKCVCKRWMSLIEDESWFAVLHFTRSKTRPGGTALLTTLNTNKEESSLLLTNEVGAGGGGVPKVVSWLETSSHETMLKPVNGLICFVNEKEGSVRIINLCTQEQTPWIEIITEDQEELNQEQKAYCDSGTFLGFPPMFFGHPPLYGFGFDPITKEHKVVRVCQTVAAHPIKNTIKLFQVCEVMTVGDNTWRWIDGVVPNRIINGDAVYVNGTIYWKSAGLSDGLNLKLDFDAFVTFDVENEKFRVIPITKFILHPLQDSNPFEGEDPAVELLEGVDPAVELLEVDGRVALLGRRSNFMAQLWIFEDHHDDKETKSNATTSTSSFRNYGNITKESISLPIAWDENKENLSFQTLPGKDSLMVQSFKDGKLVDVFSYNRKKKTFAKFAPCPSESDGQVFKRVDYTFFVESLFHVQKKKMKKQ